jgi:hypothetical protein
MALTSLLPIVLAAGPLLFTSGTEPPGKVEQVQVPADRGGRPGRLTCATYADFTVKELDLGGLGAELLAITPRDSRRKGEACSRERGRGEVALTTGEDGWFGYFEGAAGRYAFFRAVDARDDALGFAVYDGPRGQRVFADASAGPVSVKAKDGRVGLVWVKQAIAPCSPLSGGEACWARIKADLGVVDPPPDCAEAYRKANEAAAQAACQEDPQPSRLCVERELRLRPTYPPFVPPKLGYEVRIPDLGAPEVHPAPGGQVVSCQPTD